MKVLSFPETFSHVAIDIGKLIFSYFHYLFPYLYISSFVKNLLNCGEQKWAKWFDQYRIYRNLMHCWLNKKPNRLQNSISVTTLFFYEKISVYEHLECALRNLE